MAPKDKMQLSQPTASQDLDGSSRDSQDGSQLLDMSAMNEVIERHKATVKARRSEVEARLRKAHQEGFAELERRGEEYKATHDKDLKVAQRPYLEALAALLDKKERLENEIKKSLDELETTQAAVTHQMGACFKSRAEALRK